MTRVQIKMVDTIVIDFSSQSCTSKTMLSERVEECLKIGFWTRRHGATLVPREVLGNRFGTTPECTKRPRHHPETPREQPPESPPGHPEPPLLGVFRVATNLSKNNNNNFSAAARPQKHFGRAAGPHQT